MFGWWRRRKRKKLLAVPVSEGWLEILRDRVPFYGELGEDDQALLVELIRIFVSEKHFIPAGGMEIDDEVKVVIAAAAARLCLRLSIDIYDRLTEIVVYPSHYHHEDKEDAVVFGEAHDWGTVVLSWDAVVEGLGNPHDGHDTATHEFAHVLDRADGSFDGAPELRARQHYRPWAQVMQKRYDQLRDRKGNARRVLRDYGATNEAEFFAVATEAFFEKPEQMKKRTPDLYEELSRFYGLDPAGK